MLIQSVCRVLLMRSALKLRSMSVDLYARQTDQTLPLSGEIFYLWIQPAKQHGLRFPFANLSIITLILLSLVSSFFASSIQQIHSLRARGVISCQTSLTLSDETSTSLTSFGSLWTTPLDNLVLDMEVILTEISSVVYKYTKS